ncbi:growth hormone secretagogue receptor type 1-like [Diadema antillarum]|uniref:growth hormone secretagogue receptor type 1-like n=1 Tax=Diadema antillarum TaxID=105358 RepID=UPI003A85BEBB
MDGAITPLFADGETGAVFDGEGSHEINNGTDVAITELYRTVLQEFAQTTATLLGTEDTSGLVVVGRQSFEVPFLACVIILGVIGNLLVVAVYSQKDLRVTNAGLHILNLAAGDVFLLVIVGGFHITEFYYSTWAILWRTDIQCVLHRFARYVGFNITIFEMMAMAVDRYIAICHPLKFRIYCTTRRTKMKMIATWVGAFLAAIPIPLNIGTKFGESAISAEYRGKTPFACRGLPGFPHWYVVAKLIDVSLVLFILPITLTAITYTVMVFYVRRNNLKFAKVTSTNQENKLRSHWKTARVLLIIFVAYTACYVFSAAHILVQLFDPSNRSTILVLVKNIGLLSPFTNSFMNPVIYFIINPRFRVGLRNLFGLSPSKEQKKSQEKNKPNTDESTSNKTDSTAVPSKVI